MKLLMLLSIAAGLCLTSCSDSPDKSAPGSTNEPVSGGNPLNAPGDYLKANVKAQQTAVKTIDTTSINKAIDLFNVQEGRYPKDLNELVEKKFIPMIPTPPYGTKIVYDASAGSVKIVKQ